MTTNLVKSINSQIQGTQNLPITVLVHVTYFRLGEIFSRRGRLSRRKHMISLQILRISKKRHIKKQLLKDNIHQTHQFDQYHK